MLRTTCLALAASFAASTAAQSSARPDPADSRTAAPARAYESVFKNYRPYDDPKLAGWRASNEEMARLGGHAGHMPRAQESAGKRPAQGSRK